MTDKDVFESLERGGPEGLFEEVPFQETSVKRKSPCASGASGASGATHECKGPRAEPGRPVWLD